MDECEYLWKLIFDLPQQPLEVGSMMFLANRITEIINIIKKLKADNRQNDFTAKCYKNQRLIFVSKMLR
jgi:flagellar biosynthesis/type III secretory pathway chaperone